MNRSAHKNCHQVDRRLPASSLDQVVSVIYDLEQRLRQHGRNLSIEDRERIRAKVDRLLACYCLQYARAAV